MKKAFLALIFLTISTVASAATIEATLDWAGTDSAGQPEASMPCTITIHDASNDAILSTATVSSAVTGYAMPSWNVAAKDNADVVLVLYAKARDAKGNESAKSEAVTVTIPGVDTLGPCAPVIHLTIQ